MHSRRGAMEPGERDRIVTLLQSTDGVDGVGAPIQTWTTLVAEIPAARIELRGMERFAAAQLSAKLETRWEINYRSDMDPDLVDVPKTRRLQEFSRIYDIVNAEVIGRREGVELTTIAQAKT